MENALGILESRVLLGTMEKMPKVVREVALTCVVLHNMLRTHQQGQDTAPTPADDIAATANETLVNVPGENQRNLLMEALHQ